MSFFSRKQEMKLEDFCRDFYEKNLLDGTMRGIDINETFYKGFKELIVEVFPEFSKIEFSKLKEEFTVLRFELFALAWQHSFSEDVSIVQSIFTARFLFENNNQDIWDRMQRYNLATATAVKTFNCKSEMDTTLLYKDRADLFDKYINKAKRDGVNTEEEKYMNAVARVGNRIKSKKAWEGGVVSYNLSFTLLRNLGFIDDKIVEALGVEETLHRLISITKGFYNGAKESWDKVKIKG